MPGFYLPKSIQVEFHLRTWEIWIIPESRLSHKGIFIPCLKVQAGAEDINNTFSVCNYSIRESTSGFRSKNESEV